MNTSLKRSLGTCLAMLLLVTQSFALRDFSLVQQGELPRDQYLDHVNVNHVQLDKIAVKFSEDTRVRLRDGRLLSLEQRDMSQIDAFLERHTSIRVERLFQSREEQELDEYIAKAEALSGYDNADLNNWYLFWVKLPNQQPKALLEELLQIQLIQTCYYEPIASPAVCDSDPSPTTPDYLGLQDYRLAAPEGVDIDYAWSHSAYGDGEAWYYWEDIEGGWCETHEDFPSNFLLRNPPDSTDPDWYNHGTSVASIVSACNDAKGVVGLTPECRPNARNVFNHATTADAIAAVGTDLIPGENYVIELHAPGPSQGTTCTCNCGQFEYIAMEYWTANFDAILLNATGSDMLICVEAAGNGSMDLDWAGYGGAFDPGVRDSQAILVGAGSSDSTHDPMCWTNHGQRISAYGWGENVAAAGYGGLFNQTGCEQDYTSTFSGTSSATPIVAGAAISLALIHYEQEGAYADPITLRARLQTNGTAQASDFTREISVMPNMRGILAPDVAPYALGGWDAPLIVNGTYDDHTVPATLQADPDSSYFSWSYINWSRYSSAEPAATRLFVDDVYTWSTGGDLGLNSATYVRGVNKFISGGRHVTRLLCDPLDVLVEGNEGNNEYTVSYCWDGVYLTSDVPQSRYRAPSRYPAGYSYPSCDGYSNDGNLPGFWEFYAVMPDASADYDVRMYNTAPTSTTGWDYSYVASSSSVSNTDFVLANQNQGEVSSTCWLGVHNYSDSNETYTVEGEGTPYMGYPPATQSSLASGSLDDGEILDCWEFNAVAGDDIWFRVDTDTSIPLRFMIYDPNTTYGNPYLSAWEMNVNDVMPSATGTFSVTVSGYHAIALVKHAREDLHEDASYQIYWGYDSPPDLTFGLHTGFEELLVPYVSPRICGTPPTLLVEGSSWMDVSVQNIGTGYLEPGWNTRILLEGQTRTVGGDVATWLDPGATGGKCGFNLFSVKGGRHEVGAVLDAQAEVTESDESNNEAFMQYCWAPYELLNQVPVTRTPAASWRNFDNPDAYLQPAYNQDGYFIDPGYWTAVACMPLGANDQVNLQGFDHHSTDVENALIGYSSFSYTGLGLGCVNVMNGNVVGSGERDIGAHQNWAYPSHVPTDDYVIESCSSRGDLMLDQDYGPYAIGSGHLVHSYDVYITEAPLSTAFTLYNDSDSDLGMLIYQPGLGYCDYFDALANANDNAEGADESIEVTFTENGWAGLVIYKHSHTDLPLEGDYRLRLGTPPAQIPAPITDLRITPIDFSPGYATVQIDFTPVTQDMYGFPLEIDFYRLYGDELNPYDFSDPYIEDLSSVCTDGSCTLWTANVGWSTTGYIFLTAIDMDGRVVGASPGIPEEWLDLQPTTGKALISSQNQESVKEDVLKE